LDEHDAILIVSNRRYGKARDEGISQINEGVLGSFQVSLLIDWKREIIKPEAFHLRHSSCVHVYRFRFAFGLKSGNFPHHANASMSMIEGKANIQVINKDGILITHSFSSVPEREQERELYTKYVRLTPTFPRFLTAFSRKGEETTT
jgi:hypothetical protein